MSAAGNMHVNNNTDGKGFGSIMEYVNWEKEIFYSSAFPLSEKYAMVGIDWILAAEVIYGLLVWWGISRMRGDKKPMIQDGRWALRVYNLCQVILSGYISYLATCTYFKKFLDQGVLCQPMKVQIETDPDTYELETYTCWLFYISKWVDYMDTFFIIARSKWRQLSFLHCFHHSSMIALTWIATRYHPCGYFLIAAQLNAPVHTMMYFYYLCSSFPRLTPFLWWKNYITTIQLLQFVTGVVISCYCFCAQVMWGFNTMHLSFFFVFTFILYGITLFALFKHFYNQTYKAAKAKKQ